MDETLRGRPAIHNMIMALFLDKCASLLLPGFPPFLTNVPSYQLAGGHRYGAMLVVTYPYRHLTGIHFNYKSNF